MRAEDRTSGAMFSYVDVESRIAAKHPLRRDAAADRCGAGGSRPGFFVALRQVRAPVHSGGAALADDASAASLLDPVGAATGRADRVRHAVSLSSSGFRSTRRFSTQSTFSKNRDCLLMQEIAQRFLASRLALPEVKGF